MLTCIEIPKDSFNKYMRVIEILKSYEFDVGYGFSHHEKYFGTIWNSCLNGKEQPCYIIYDLDILFTGSNGLWGNKVHTRTEAPHDDHINKSVAVLEFEYELNILENKIK